MEACTEDCGPMVPRNVWNSLTTPLKSILVKQFRRTLPERFFTITWSVSIYLKPKSVSETGTKKKKEEKKEIRVLPTGVEPMTS